MSVVQFAGEGEAMRWTDPQEEERVEQKPSICRNVLYQSHGSPDGRYPSVPRAAVITVTYADEPSLVGLCVLNPTGIFFDQHVPYDPDGKPGTWRWPPRV